MTHNLNEFRLKNSMHSNIKTSMKSFFEWYKTYIIVKIILSNIQIKSSEINRAIRLITINFQNLTKILLNLSHF